MTSTVTQVTINSITANSFETLSTTFGVVVIVLLCVLLIEKELIRSLNGPRTRTWIQALNIAIFPLSLTFGLIIALRLAALLG